MFGRKRKNTFRVIDNDGKLVKCEVLFTFKNEETGKHYIVYTDHGLDGEGNEKAFASIYDPTARHLELLPIETEREWEVVNELLNAMQKMRQEDGQMPDPEDDRYAGV